MAKIIGPALSTIPWQERPAGARGTVWRYSGNPIITRDAIPDSNSIFNSAAVPFGDGFAGVFRSDDCTRLQKLHAGFSRDGFRWELSPEPIRFTGAPPEIAEFQFGYDPRVCLIDGEYIVSWCNGYAGYPTIGLAKTGDFRTFTQMENAFLPFNRNGVLFPRKINGKYVMLSRPSDNAHTAFGDIFLSRSPDLVHWGEHRLVMKTTEGWQSKKIGAGPIPIETDEGWLMIYHGVLWSCNGFVYSFGAALLDLDDPSKVIARSRSYLLSPQELYECVGDVPNVVFPCAALCDAATGRIAIYYGCADTSTGLCFGYLDDILDHLYL
ncbi:MAG: glycosidase [Lentisphaeria bacterium]|nr:glycosidase [Lentisphaeria bacterium]